MKLIKLNAIDSTNDFLKELVSTQITENYTVVSAQNQLKGKGQMGSNWNSEEGKNLTFSVLLNNVVENVGSIYSLNIAVALAVLEILKGENIPDLKIKWPNDIMSGNKKLGGILVENSIKNTNEIQSIIGIGLNVNQQNYIDLPQASSMCLTTGQFYNCEDLLVKIVDRLKINFQLLQEHHSEIFWQKYHEYLFKKDIPSAFENKDLGQFMGIIKQVTKDGQLQVLLENDAVKQFSVKEIKMLY